MSIEKLLEIPLICLKSGKPLFRDGGWLVSDDSETRLRYPIRNEIPIMLSNEAEEMSVEDWEEAKQRAGQ